jgi:hypothetical protein
MRALALGLLALTLSGCTSYYAYGARGSYRPLAGQPDEQLVADQSACIAQSCTADRTAAAVAGLVMGWGVDDREAQGERRQCMVERGYCLPSLRGSYSHWKDGVWTTEPGEPAAWLCDKGYSPRPTVTSSPPPAGPDPYGNGQGGRDCIAFACKY